MHYLQRYPGNWGEGRHSRSLLPIFGEIDKTLFGSAINNDVLALKTAMNELIKNQHMREKILKTNVEYLATLSASIDSEFSRIIHKINTNKERAIDLLSQVA